MSSTARTHLNFNLIAKVTMSRAQSDDLEKRLKELKRYVPGSPVKPHDGFEMIELDTSDELPDNEMARFLDRMVGVRHIHETYQAPREAFFRKGSSKEETGDVRKIHQTEVYWIKPSLLVISGPKNDTQVSLRTFRYLAKGATIEPFSFEPKFFMWIVYKHRERSSSLVKGLDIDFISDAVTIGSIDRMGRITKVQQSTDVSRAIQTVMTILGGKDLSELICGFSVDSKWRTTVKIVSSGSVRVYASVGTPSLVRGGMKRGISLVVTEKIVNAYNQWQNLPLSEKYPPPNFFKRMAGEAEREGVIIFGMKLQELVKTYAKLRTGR